jgi:transcriptional regulator with XRE-family HTH domain
MPDYGGMLLWKRKQADLTQEELVKLVPTLTVAGLTEYERGREPMVKARYDELVAAIEAGDKRKGPE